MVCLCNSDSSLITFQKNIVWEFKLSSWRDIDKIHHLWILKLHYDTILKSGSFLLNYQIINYQYKYCKVRIDYMY